MNRNLINRNLRSAIFATGVVGIAYVSALAVVALWIG